jgi:hypothetical protein
VKHPGVGGGRLVLVNRGIFPPVAHGGAQRVQALGQAVVRVGLLGGGVDFGLRQVRERIERDRAAPVARGGQDEGHGAFDLAGAELLAGGGQEERHLQSGGQATELESGQRPELSGLNEGAEIRAQAPDEPQAPAHPGRAFSKQPADGGRGQVVVAGQVFDEPGFFPQGDGAALGVQGEQQGFGLPAVRSQDADVSLANALGLEHGQAFEAVDEFQAAGEADGRQGFLERGGAEGGGRAGRCALEALESGAELFEIHLDKFHGVWFLKMTLDFLLFSGLT